MSSELEKRIQLLEEKFEYQDRMMETLDQVIIEQQGQIDGLKKELQNLREEIGAADTDFKDINEPPPHY